MYPELDSIEIPIEMEHIQEVKLKFHLIDNSESITHD
jgi:hypothetical protein